MVVTSNPILHCFSGHNAAVFGVLHYMHPLFHDFILKVSLLYGVAEIAKSHDSEMIMR